MPQRLFDVITQGPYQHVFGPGWVLRAPTLAAKIQNAISIWSYLEAVAVTRLLAGISGSSSATAVAAYEALNSDATKLAVLAAVAETHITDQKYDLLKAILSDLKKQASIRHKLVHGIWGYSQNLPNNLLLISSKDFAAGRPGEIQGIAFNGPVSTKDAEYFKKIEVYTQSDIDEVIMRFTKTLQRVEQFNLLWSPHFPGDAKDHVFVQLCNELGCDALLGHSK